MARIPHNQIVMKCNLYRAQSSNPLLSKWLNLDGKDVRLTTMETKSPQKQIASGFLNKKKPSKAVPDLHDEVPSPSHAQRDSVIDVKLPDRNLTPAMSTTLNLCVWLHYRAGLDGDILQPMKLQRLLYLSQAIYAAKTGGRRLVPATFLATDRGPIEPNIYQLYEHGAPTVGARRPGEELENFLEVIWRKYGHHNPDHLLRVISRDSAFYDTLQRFPSGEITIDAMATEYQKNTEGKRVEINNYSQDGKMLKNWKPRQVDKSQVINKSAKSGASGGHAAPAGGGEPHPLAKGLPWRRIK